MKWKFEKTLHKKWSFPLGISAVNVTKFADLVTADLVIFTEENLNGKLHFLCSEIIHDR